MPLNAGERLGPYEIVAPIGAGGMGEVYRARDSRLGRDVAVKVLPASFAQDAERLRRFEQEARAAGALNHPNILAIHDLGTHEGSPYIVSELLEGQTLRERMSESQLPLRKALDYAVQIANGLGAAHEKGITHRDLKPENLFITKDGRVKILDFGLAKLSQPEGAAAAASDAQTLATQGAPVTHPGVVLGTVGYMSPEQVRGRASDHRSDLFSLGTILYEMVSGQRAFCGDSSIETMNAILKEDPPEISSANRAAPPALDRLIRRCLEKSPEERFQSARDLAFALEALSGHSGTTAVQAAVDVKRKSWLLPAVAVALFAVVAGGSFVAGLWKGRGIGASRVSFQPMTFRPLTIFRAAFAPDGKTFVYSAALSGNRPELFVLTADYPEPRPLGLKDAQLLSVSSKGELALILKAQYVGHRLFEGTLARIPLAGGAPREILDGVREADWSPDGDRLAIIRSVNGKDQLEFPAGKVLYETPGYLSDLRFSPEGQHIAFFIHPYKYDDRGSVAVMDLTGKVTTLSSGYWGLEGLAWSPDGKEILYSGGNSYSSFVIYAVTLAGARREALESAGGLTIHDVSKSGQWLVTRDDHRRDMYGLLPGAKTEQFLSFLDFSQPIDLSADSRTLLFTEESGVFGSNYAICIRKLDGSLPVRLGEGAAMGLSPDGKSALGVIFTSPPQFVIYPTGAGDAKKLDATGIENPSGASWYPDGKRVLLCGSEPGHSSRCYSLEIAGGKLHPVTPEGTIFGSVSPDGKLILASRSEGETVLYPAEGGAARPLPFLKEKDQVYRWSLDSHSLFVGDGTVIPAVIERVDLATGRRTVVKRIVPPDLTGVLGISSAVLNNDASVYVYAYREHRSSLFLLNGAR
jgi:eukaryotic-like serine/threonine-protein kinase